MHDIALGGLKKRQLYPTDGCNKSSIDTNFLRSNVSELGKVRSLKRSAMIYFELFFFSNWIALNFGVPRPNVPKLIKNSECVRVSGLKHVYLHN